MAIVLTAHAQHAVRGFDLQVVDYLLKPIDDIRFGEALAHRRPCTACRKLLAAGCGPGPCSACGHFEQ